MKAILKRSASILAGSETFERFVALLEHRNGQRTNLLRVLTYHRVDEPDNRPHLDPGLLSATPDDFEGQMAYLAANYDVLSMPELLGIIAKNASLPPRAVVVTCDDAYCDFEEHIWPIAQNYGIPIALFVATDYPDQPEKLFWWDRLYHAIRNASAEKVLDTPLGAYPLSTFDEKAQAFRVIKGHVKSRSHAEALSIVDHVCNQLDVAGVENAVLSWESLRRLAREGVTLGAHTRTHPLMHQLPLHEAHDELKGSIQDLNRQIGEVLPIFAYPGGGLNDEVVKILREEGICVAFTTLRGINNMPKADPLKLRRINIGARTTLQLLRAQMLPLAEQLNLWWSFSGM